MLPVKFRVSVTSLRPKNVYLPCFKSSLASANVLSSEHKRATEWNEAKPLSKMPGPAAWPILGTAWQLLPIIGNGMDINKQHVAQLKMYEEYGDIWRIVLPGLGLLISTANPEDVELIFRNEGKFPARPTFETLKNYRLKRVDEFNSGGILLENGETWWNIRSKVQQPMLKAQNLMTYLPSLSEIADDFIKRIRELRDSQKEMPPDFHNEMYKWALESVGLVSLNTRLGCLDPNMPADSEPQLMIKAVNDSFSALNKLEFGIPLWRIFETPLYKKLIEAQNYFTDTSVKYINKTLEKIKNRPPESEDDTTMLEALLLRGLSPRDTVAMVIDMLMAGIDTTSHTTSFLLYHLARNPDKQEILRREIAAVIPGDAAVTPQVLSQLPYMKACIKESLRMMPAVTGNARIIDKDLVLSGYQVPKGTLVQTAHQVMCRLEKFFPEPDSFIPERWIKGHPLENNAHPYVMLPFGFGMRMCVGRRLAEQEMWLLTIKIMQNFKVEYHYGEMDCLTRVVNTPDKPLKFRFIDISA